MKNIVLFFSITSAVRNSLFDIHNTNQAEWTLCLAFKIKKPRPKDCRGFQNTFRMVMGSTPAYSPLVHHGDEIIIAVK
jgi:hypothetical protein